MHCSGQRLGGLLLRLEGQQLVPPHLQPPHLQISQGHQTLKSLEIQRFNHLSLGLVLPHPCLDLQFADDPSPLLDHLTAPLSQAICATPRFILVTV